MIFGYCTPTEVQIGFRRIFVGVCGMDNFLDFTDSVTLVYFQKAKHYFSKIAKTRYQG